MRDLFPSSTPWKRGFLNWTCKSSICYFTAYGTFSWLEKFVFNLSINVFSCINGRSLWQIATEKYNEAPRLIILCNQRVTQGNFNTLDLEDLHSHWRLFTTRKSLHCWSIILWVGASDSGFTHEKSLVSSPHPSPGPKWGSHAHFCLHSFHPSPPSPKKRYLSSFNNLTPGRNTSKGY